MTESEYKHKPVLIDEVMTCLNPDDAGVYVDCTFGRGGYTKRILDVLGADGQVVALDADPDAIAHGEQVYGNEPRLKLRHKNYDRIIEVLKELALPLQIDGIVFDLGVSSPQLDDASRGFSFRYDGPLDMRMNPTEGVSAAEWIGKAEPAEMLRVIARLGEEKLAGLIVRNIVKAREKQAITGTAQLAEIIYSGFPEKEKRKRKIHPATKVFQAIRMHVNDELGHLERALEAAKSVLAINGVLAVVAFHSLEDRMVKRFFRDCVLGEALPDGLPVKEADLKSDYEYVARLVKPSDEEVTVNARARSARLRAIRRVA